MKIAVTVESTNDLSKDLLNKYDIKVIPYEITIGDLTFKDGKYTTEEVFGLVDKYNVLPKTTALNPYEYSEFFENILKDYDAVIHVALSSGITSSCGNAFRGAEMVKNAYCIDSKSLSTGIGLVAIYCRELADSGKTPEEIVKLAQERVEKLQVSFVIERLDYMHKGGRCTSIQLLGANVFHFRPRIVMKNGKMSSDGKYRGRMENVIAKYCEEILAQYNTPDKSRVFITYTTATPEMISAAKTACENAGFKEILETQAGGTIASHCGANTLGILYFNDGKTE